MELSKEQQIAFDNYILGKNIFVTGPGGSGKSELIKKIYNHAIENYKEINVCALTGCAAVLLGCKAKTLHCWAGIGLGKSSIQDTITKIKKKPYLREEWINTDILIIDEVSMLSLKLFEMLNKIGKAIRRNQSPFGGIQLLFFGDFYQLPPVGDREDLDSQKFCFESMEWNSIFPNDCQIQLVKIFRQTDLEYTNILNEIREGRISNESIVILHQYIGRVADSTLIIEPTKLFPVRKKVDEINQGRLAELSGTQKLFAMNYIISEKKLDTLETNLELDFIAKNLLCDNEIVLKIGAQVMCIINIMKDDDNGEDNKKEILLCNGSQGIVIGFCEKSGFPIVKYNNGVERIMALHVWLSERNQKIGVSQIPLILAWALTIHKSQGCTLDAAEMDIGSTIFEYGQSYVALSRVKGLNGLYLSSFDHKKIRVHKKVKDYYRGLLLVSEEQKGRENRYEEKRELYNSNYY
jgi:ATP-dependent DNA helicase PIF1